MLSARSGPAAEQWSLRLRDEQLSPDLVLPQLFPSTSLLKIFTLDTSKFI